ncbi:dephospho-CoA kinase [Pelagibacterales bacterium SAG-MED17]|nr:dephospho-CoA kinase [Pelagibacterales bacterium SAG-MED17]
MIKIAVLGDIGSGKSFVAKQFGYPVFDADKEVTKIYRSDRSCYKKIKKNFPSFINSKIIKKNELGNVIRENKKNLKKISDIVHPIVRKRMHSFIKKNNKKKMLVFDIPLLVENKLYDKNFYLIFIQAAKNEIDIRLKKRPLYNKNIINSLRKAQKSLLYKKKISNFILKNNFKLQTVKKRIKIIKKEIINERNSS